MKTFTSFTQPLLRFLKPLINLIQIRRAAFFWVSLTFFLLMGSLMLDSGRCLKTRFAPNGILTFELVFKQEKADRIKKDWAEKQCVDGRIITAHEGLSSTNTPRPVIDLAISNTKLDFVFIIAYFFFIAVLVIRKNVNTTNLAVFNRTWRYLTILSLAALFDCIENIFIIRFLQGSTLYPASFAIPALLKFICLLIVVFYILSKLATDVSRTSGPLMRSLWQNRISAMGLLIMYVALWKSDQGQDLLLNLNAHDVGPVLFYFILTVMAALNWFMPKYYAHDFVKKIRNKTARKTMLKNPSQLQQGYEIDVPRILGVMTFVIPACAILNALKVMRIDYLLDSIPPMILLIITTVAYVVIAHKKYVDTAFDRLHGRKKGWIFFAAILVILGIIGAFGVINRNAPHQLANLSIGLFLMSAIFFIVTTLRTDPRFYEIKVVHWFRFQPASYWLAGVSAISVGIFFYVSLYPLDFPYIPYARYITLPVVFTGITFYTIFFYILFVLGKRFNINWAAIVVIAGLFMAIIFENRFHDIFRMDRTAETKVQKLDEYIDNWIAARKDEIASSTVYPVFIVNTYGGGIRAAAWTSLVVSRLDSLTGGDFQRHVFAYSGASGGTIGASIMLALRKSKKKEVTREDVLNFYQHDFLTPVLIGLMGRDIFFSSTGWDAVDDRSRLQDQIWENHLFSLDSGIYSKEFCSLWYDTPSRMYDIPLLFANTYHVESGLKGILAPVKLDMQHFPQAVDVYDKLGGHGLPLSTASFLSARFPYISPAARLDSVHHFLDGGLKENSGAETAYELYNLLTDQTARKEVDSVLRKKDPGLVAAYKKIKIYFLSLNNTGNHDPEATTKNMVELTAPVTALYNNWVGNTLKADSVLGARMRGSYYQLRPLKDTIKHEGFSFRPVLPLGWQISDFALQRLNESLIYPKEDAKLPSTPGKISAIVKLLENSKARKDEMPIVTRFE